MRPLLFAALMVMAYFHRYLDYTIGRSPNLQLGELEKLRVQGIVVMVIGKGKSPACAILMWHFSRPIFNQESNGIGFRSEKRSLVGHIRNQRSMWSKIDSRRKTPSALESL